MAKQAEPLGVAKQAELLRQDGNTFFSKGRFAAAIDAYTAAITLCPDVAVYFTNRGLCHMKRNEWTRVEEDSRRAAELDSNSVKGHYLLGLALLERKENAEGIKELEKALDLGRGAHPTGYIVEEIWQVLANAKHLEWEESSSKEAWKLQKLKEACEIALTEHHSLSVCVVETESEEDKKEYVDNLEYLNDVFRKVAQLDEPTEVPGYLCCQITLDIFRDPVISPSGVTYERAVLIQHLHKVGKFDPITREPLEEHQLVPNRAIKEAVQAFLKEHGWAYKMS